MDFFSYQNQVIMIPNSVCLQATKRLRLDFGSTRSNSVNLKSRGSSGSSGADDNIQTSRTSQNKPFEWDNYKIELLVYGMIRKNVNKKVGVRDISAIILYYTKNTLKDYHLHNSNYSTIKYLSDKSILCNFRILGDSRYQMRYHHAFSLVVFTPYISDIFDNKISSIKKINDKPPDNFNIVHDMKVSVTKCQCASFGNNHFWLHLGVICIPKNKKIGFNEIENTLLSNKNYASKKERLSLYFNQLRNASCGDDFDDCDASNDDKSSKWGDIESYFLEVSPSVTYMYINDIYKDLSSIKCTKKDFFQMRIEGNINSYDSNQYYLSFLKSDEIIGRDQKFNIFREGKIALNFDKFDYLFALSSDRCGCPETQDVDGFEYKVTTSTKIDYNCTCHI